MVNLLFISSDSKIDIIKNALQPLLKVKIDSVGDFDYGLKEVFEKRPAMVFFQDQIAGVTGESVARHIQMLLGSDAPSFIFMHNGNTKAKSIKGLYDNLIDLSQENAKVVADIQSTLKSLLGSQWEKIYVPPQAIKPVVLPPLAATEEQSVIVDQFEDNSTSSPGGGTYSFKNKSPVLNAAVNELSTEESSLFVSSTEDQLEDIIATTALGIKDNKTVSATASNSGIKAVSVNPETASSTVNQTPTVNPQKTATPGALGGISGIASTDKSLSAQSVSQKHTPPTIAPTHANMSEKYSSSQISPAAFRIEKENIGLEAATEESLRAFEAEYLTKTAARKRYQAVAVLVVLCVFTGGWYLVKQKPNLLQPIIKKSSPAVVPAPATPVPVVQKSISTTQRQATTRLPSFIPLAGHDSTFASQKPGWERYVSADSEFRVYCTGSKLRALQVLSTQGHEISESRLKGILIELTGTGEYRTTSIENKFGFQVSHATIDRKADLLIYRKESSVHAFVVSLE